jgi:hypothetical protein
MSDSALRRDATPADAKIFCNRCTVIGAPYQKSNAAAYGPVEYRRDRIDDDKARRAEAVDD